MNSVQVNIPAESGEMGILAQHVPSIEQLKPGLVEIIEEAGGSKQFFCKWLLRRFDEEEVYRRREQGDALEEEHVEATIANEGTPSVSGGFATVQPGSVLSINAVEGYPLEDFSADVSQQRSLTSDNI